MQPEPLQKITREAYLDLERKAEIKSEFFDGEMFAMAGASRKHNLILCNIISILRNQLIDGPCNVYPSDMKVRVERINKYAYPEIAIACEPELFEDDHNDILLNPVVVIEILSDATEAYDRGKKFIHCQFIPSLVEYILVSQHSHEVERFVRQKEGAWIYSRHDGPEGRVPVGAAGCELPLWEIYRSVVL